MKYLSFRDYLFFPQYFTNFLIETFLTIFPPIHKIILPFHITKTYIHDTIFKIFNIYFLYVLSFFSFFFYKSPRILLLIQNVSKTITRKRTWRNLFGGVRANTIPLGTSLHVKDGSSFVHAADRQDPMGTFPCRHVWQGCNRRSTRPLHETSLSRSSLSRESNETS